MVPKFSQKVWFVSSQSLSGGGCRQWADTGWDQRQKWLLSWGGCHHSPLPRKHQHTCIMVPLAWLSGSVVTCKAEASSPDLGSRTRAYVGGMKRQTPDFPHLCLPTLSNILFCLLHDILCLSLKKPQAEEALKGHDWSRRMSAGGHFQFCQLFPAPSPLLWAFWTPLPTPFILGLLRFEVHSHSQALQPTPRELRRASSKGAGKKPNHASLQLGTVSEVLPSLLVSQVIGLFSGGEKWIQLSRVWDKRGNQTVCSQAKNTTKRSLPPTCTAMV